MKKRSGLVLVFVLVLVILLVNGVYSISILGHNCDTIRDADRIAGTINVGNKILSSDCNDYIGGDGCFEGKKVVICGSGATYTNWWIEPCGGRPMESCTDITCGDGSCNGDESVSNCFQDCCTSYTWYADNDDDGYYNGTNVSSCTRPSNIWKNDTEITSTTLEDCNDTNININPGRPEICGNGIDDNCDERQCNIVLNKPYWANLRDYNLNISRANKSDEVLMIVPGVSIGSQEVNYTIYKENSIFFGLIKWSTAIETSRTSAIWNITDTGTFYFKAQIGSIWNQSDNLIVTGYDNSNPVAVITTPLNNEKFSVGQQISFNHSSYDEDDLLRVNWTFGDGTSFSVDNYSLALTPNLGNVMHNYTSSGLYTIVLNVSEMARGKSSVQIRQIRVFKEGINTVAVFTTPLDGFAYGNFVVFNSNQSYVSNCSSSLIASIDFPAGALNCAYLHRPGISTTGNYNLTANLTVFSRGVLSLSRVGNWSANYSDIVMFDNYFPDSANHQARLVLDYN